MLEEVRQQVDATVVPLLKGILDDTQTLVRQEITLAKVEVKEDAIRVRDAAMAFSGGALAATLAAVMLTFTLVHIIAATFPDLPMWAAYGAVTALVGAAAAVLLAGAIRKVKQVRVVPKQTVETMKENVHWIQRKV